MSARQYQENRHHSQQIDDAGEDQRGLGNRNEESAHHQRPHHEVRDPNQFQCPIADGRLIVSPLIDERVDVRARLRRGTPKEGADQ